MTDLLRLVDCDLDGWERGLPSPSAVIADAGICGNSTCTQCGRRGLLYVPWVRFDGLERVGYRAFAVCPQCDHAEEF